MRCERLIEVVCAFALTGGLVADRQVALRTTLVWGVLGLCLGLLAVNTIGWRSLHWFHRTLQIAILLLATAMLTGGVLFASENWHLALLLVVGAFSLAVLTIGRWNE